MTVLTFTLMTSWYEEPEEEQEEKSTRGDNKNYPRIIAHSWYGKELLLTIEEKRNKINIYFADNYNWTIQQMDNYLEELMKNKFYKRIRRQAEQSRILNYLNKE